MFLASHLISSSEEENCFCTSVALLVQERAGVENLFCTSVTLLVQEGAGVDNLTCFFTSVTLLDQEGAGVENLTGLVTLLGGGRAGALIKSVCAH